MVRPGKTIQAHLVAGLVNFGGLDADAVVSKWRRLDSDMSWR